MSVHFEGLDELLNSLEELADVNKLERSLGMACALVERAAKQKAPKDNGDLKERIKSEVEHNGDEIQGVVFAPLEYAPYVEYGTGLFAEKGGRKDVPWHYQDDEGKWHTISGQKPKPFMRPALDENRDQILRIIKEGLLND